MDPGRVLGDEQRLGDLAVRGALAQQAEDLALAAGQRGADRWTAGGGRIAGNGLDGIGQGDPCPGRQRCDRRRDRARAEPVAINAASASRSRASARREPAASNASASRQRAYATSNGRPSVSHSSAARAQRSGSGRPAARAASARASATLPESSAPCTSRYVSGPAVTRDEVGCRGLGASRCGLRLVRAGAAGGPAPRDPPRPAPVPGRASPSTSRTRTAASGAASPRARSQRRRPDESDHNAHSDRTTASVGTSWFARAATRGLLPLHVVPPVRWPGREEVEPHVVRGPLALVLGEDRERRRPVADLEVVPGPDDLDVHHPDAGAPWSSAAASSWMRAEPAASPPPSCTLAASEKIRPTIDRSRVRRASTRARSASASPSVLAADRGQGAGDADACNRLS